MTKSESAKERVRHEVNFLYDVPPGFKDGNVYARPALHLPLCSHPHHALTCPYTEKPEEGEKLKLTMREERQLPLSDRHAVLKGAPREE
jgi:hypothetical protein